MISVIIVTYNQEDTIGRAIDSVLMQQCNEDIEILVADDASQDSTPDVCKKYAERHPDKIRLFLNKTNKGLIDNYFDTLLECRGDLIADCAGDDQWCDPLKLEKERLIMRKHEDVTLVHTAWKKYIEKTGQLEDSPKTICSLPFVDGKELLEDIIVQTNMPVVHLCTALYRKEPFLIEYDKHRELFRTKEYGCEDLQLVFAMALHGRIAYLPDVTLHYTIGADTISNCGNYDKQFSFVLRVSELSYALSKTYDVKSERINKYFSLRLYELLMHTFRTHSKKNRREALKCQQRWKADDTPITILLKMLTSTDLLWKTTLFVRNHIVSMKRNHIVSMK